MSASESTCLYDWRAAKLYFLMGKAILEESAMKYQLPQKYHKIFQNKLEEICKSSRLLESHRYMQHGTTSVFRHSVSVAYVSYYLALKWKLEVDVDSLLRGALLHDYFLYDWHEKDASHRWHGYHHADKALGNALEDFPLNEIERDMIYCHMFPLNLTRVPKYKESWLLCWADKLCSSAETVEGFADAVCKLVMARGKKRQQISS